MKKTNIRVHRNGGSKSVRSQVPKNKDAETAAPVPKSPTNQEAQPASLLFLTNMDDNLEELAGWDYSAAEFAEVQRMAKLNGETLAEFMFNAIHARLNPPHCDLEPMVDQAEALAMLFQEQLLNGSDGDWNENIKAGFVELSAQTFNRLRAEVKRLEASLTVKGGAL